MGFSLYLCDLPCDNVHGRLSVYKPFVDCLNDLVTRSFVETSISTCLSGFVDP